MAQLGLSFLFWFDWHKTGPWGPESNKDPCRPFIRYSEKVNLKTRMFTMIGLFKMHKKMCMDAQILVHAQVFFQKARLTLSGRNLLNRRWPDKQRESLKLVPRIINSNAQMAYAGLARKRLAFIYWLRAQGVRLKDKTVLKNFPLCLMPCALCLCVTFK